MGNRGRLLFCGLSLVMLTGQLMPVARANEGNAHLAREVSVEDPVNGGDLLLDGLKGFPPGPGQARIEPGTANEETIEYNGVGSDPDRLFGIERPTPLEHAEGADVVYVPPEGTPESSPSADPGPASADGHDVGGHAGPSDPAQTTETIDQAADGALAGIPSPESGSASSEPPPTQTSANMDSTCTAPCVPPECLPPIADVVNFLVACTHADELLNPPPCADVTSCHDLIVQTLCPVSAIFCFLPPPTPEVIDSVDWDDIFFFPTPYDGGCGYAGFTAHTVNGQPATQHESYIVTATTEASLSAPQRYQGNLDSAGRAVIYYCPPPGIVSNSLEVTFTATVQAVTSVAERAWSDPQLDDPCDAVTRVLPAAYTPCKTEEGPAFGQAAELAGSVDGSVFVDLTDNEDVDQVQPGNNTAGASTNEVTVDESSTTLPGQANDGGAGAGGADHSSAHYISGLSCHDKVGDKGYYSGRSLFWRPDHKLDDHKWRIIDQQVYAQPRNGHRVWVVSNQAEALYENPDGDMKEASPLGFDEYQDASYTLSVGYAGFGASATWNAGQGYSGGGQNQARTKHWAGWFKWKGAGTGKSSKGESLWRIQRAARPTWYVSCGATFG